jgi:hypothetical protein
MMVVGKMVNGKIVQIVRYKDTVGFSPEKGWIFVCFDFDKMFHKREVFKWIKATEARFQWVREFVG